MTGNKFMDECPEEMGHRWPLHYMLSPVHTQPDIFIYLTFCQRPLQHTLTWKQPLACSRQAEMLGPVLKEHCRRQEVATDWLKVA